MYSKLRIRCSLDSRIAIPNVADGEYAPLQKSLRCAGKYQDVLFELHSFGSFADCTGVKKLPKASLLVYVNMGWIQKEFYPIPKTLNFFCFPIRTI
jgi:hypothetical protein